MARADPEGTGRTNMIRTEGPAEGAPKNPNAEPGGPSKRLNAQEYREPTTEPDSAAAPR